MIELRDLQDEDRARLFRWRLQPEVDRWMSDPPPSTTVEHDRWFDDLRLDANQAAWIITCDAEPAGLLTLSGLEGRHRRAAWGWYIGEAWARGRGVGRAAQALGLDLAFLRMNLEKVWAEVLADNAVALRAQAAAGFLREGYMRSHIFKDGVFRDVVVLAILAESWMNRRADVRAGLVRSRLIADQPGLAVHQGY